MKKKLFTDTSKQPQLLHLSNLFLFVFLFVFLSQNSLAQTETTIEILAEGLINPKGMIFDKHGQLIITESGKPGNVKIPLPAAYGIAPLGDSGRISLISDGERHDFITGLPNMGIYDGREMLGPTSVALVNDELFYLPAVHVTEVPKLYKIVDGELEIFAEIGEFNIKTPPPPVTAMLPLETLMIWLRWELIFILQMEILTVSLKSIKMPRLKFLLPMKILR